MKLDLSLSAAENARVVLPKMARKYFEAGRDAIEGKRPPEELHTFRLATKRFRYTLELFRPLYGPSLDRYLKSLRQLQGALGAVSDCQAIWSVLEGDVELRKRIEGTLKTKVRELRKSWRAFDSEGELKRWRTYLAGEHSKPRGKRRSRPPAKSTPQAAKKTVVRPQSSHAQTAVTQT